MILGPNFLFWKPSLISIGLLAQDRVEWGFPGHLGSWVGLEQANFMVLQSFAESRKLCGVKESILS